MHTHEGTRMKALDTEPEDRTAFHFCVKEVTGKIQLCTRRLALDRDLENSQTLHYDVTLLRGRAKSQAPVHQYNNLRSHGGSNPPMQGNLPPAGSQTISPYSSDSGVWMAPSSYSAYVGGVGGHAGQQHYSVVGAHSKIGGYSEARELQEAHQEIMKCRGMVEAAERDRCVCHQRRLSVASEVGGDRLAAGCT